VFAGNEVMLGHSRERQGWLTDAKEAAAQCLRFRSHKNYMSVVKSQSYLQASFEIGRDCRETPSVFYEILSS